MRIGIVALITMTIIPVIAGCAHRTERTARIHLRDHYSNDFASGMNTSSFFAVIGGDVLPETQMKISTVPQADKFYQQANAPDEYYVDITLNADRRGKEKELLLFHQDAVGNEGVTRVLLISNGDFTARDAQYAEIPDIKWRILHEFTRRYRRTGEIPQRALDFMAYYDMFKSPFIIMKEQDGL